MLDATGNKANILKVLKISRISCFSLPYRFNKELNIFSVDLKSTKWARVAFYISWLEPILLSLDVGYSAATQKSSDRITSGVRYLMLVYTLLFSLTTLFHSKYPHQFAQMLNDIQNFQTRHFKLSGNKLA